MTGAGGFEEWLQAFKGMMRDRSVGEMVDA